MESHPGEHYRRIFQEVLHKQCFGRIQNDMLWEYDGEDKDDSDWVTAKDSVVSDGGECDE
jgi:hypothetical protein